MREARLASRWTRRPACASLLLLGLAASACAGLPARPPETLPIVSVAADEGIFRAGAAAVEITPEGSVWMAGYHPARRSRSIHDPLYARALVLERGGVQLGLVALDVIGIQREDVQRWQPLFEALGFPPHRVIVHATHNHSGPDTLGLWGLPPLVSGQDDDYMRTLGQAVAAALEAARDALRPAELAAVGVSVDPRGILKNLRRPGLVDRELVVVHLREAGAGDTIATLVELGCHPEVLGASNREITADFPGYTLARLEERLGGVGIYVSGALGGLVTPDVAPAEPGGEESGFAEAERLGHQVAELALAALASSPSYQAEPHLVARHAPFLLRNQNFRYRLVRWTGVLDRRMYRGGYLLSEVNWWEVGRLRLASVPGEITPDLGLRIKQSVGGDPTLLLGLANDELGYLMPAADFELPIYSYERTVSPGPDAGDRIERLFRDLRLLADQERGGGAALPR